MLTKSDGLVTEGIGHILVQLPQILCKRFFQTDMYRSHEIFIMTGDERHLSSREVFYLKVFQYARDFHLRGIVNVNSTPHGIVSPMLMSANVSFIIISSFVRAIRPALNTYPS